MELPWFSTGPLNSQGSSMGRSQALFLLIVLSWSSHGVTTVCGSHFLVQGSLMDDTWDIHGFSMSL